MNKSNLFFVHSLENARHIMDEYGLREYWFVHYGQLFDQEPTWWICEIKYNPNDCGTENYIVQLFLLKKVDVCKKNDNCIIYQGSKYKLIDTEYKHLWLKRLVGYLESTEVGF